MALQGEEQGGEGAGDAAWLFVDIPSKSAISSSPLQEKKNAAETTNDDGKQTKKDKKESEKKVEIKNVSNGANLSLYNLSQQLDVAEEAQVGLQKDGTSLIGHLKQQPQKQSCNTETKKIALACCSFLKTNTKTTIPL